MTQLALQFKSPLVFCWGRCGGWGMREHAKPRMVPLLRDAAERPGT